MLWDRGTSFISGYGGCAREAKVEMIQYTHGEDEHDQIMDERGAREETGWGDRIFGDQRMKTQC